MEPPRLGGPLGEPVRVLPHSDRPDLWLRLGALAGGLHPFRALEVFAAFRALSIGTWLYFDSGIRSCPSRPEAARRRGSPRLHPSASGRSARPRPIRKWASSNPKVDDGRRSRTPVDSTRRAANRSARGSPDRRRRAAETVEPPRGRTQLKASARRSKKSSRTARFEATISRLLAMTRSRARRPMSASTPKARPSRSSCSPSAEHSVRGRGPSSQASRFT